MAWSCALLLTTFKRYCYNYFENTKCRLLFTSFPLSQEHSEDEAVAVSAMTGTTVLCLHSHSLLKDFSKPRHFYNMDTVIWQISASITCPLAVSEING